MKRCLVVWFFFSLLWVDYNAYGKVVLSGERPFVNPNEITGNDERISVLYNIADSLSFSDPNRALDYCNEILVLSDSLGLIPPRIDAFHVLSRIFYIKGQLDTAKVVCEEAIELSRINKDYKRLGRSTYMLGVILNSLEGPEAAYKKFRESYTQHLSINDSVGISDAYNGMGATFYSRSSDDSAVYYYLSAVRIAEKINYLELLGKAYNNLGLIYGATGDSINSIKYLKKSILINEELNNTVTLTIAYNSLAHQMLEKNRLDSAKMLYTKLLELSAQMGYLQGCADAYNGLSDVADRMGQLDKTRSHLIEARKYYRMMGENQGILLSTINIGRNEIRRGNYSTGLHILDTALIQAKEGGYLFRQFEVYWNFVDAYRSMGNFQKAFEYLTLKYDVLDSIKSIERNNEIERLKIDYEVEKEKAEKQALKAENLQKDLVVERRTLQRNTYLYTGTGIIALFIFFFSYYSQRTRKNRIINEQKIKQLEEEKKLLAARFLVEGQEEERKRIAKELHDGLGVLLSSAKMHFTTLRDKTPENKSLIDKAARLLEQATGDVRRISHNMMPGLLTKYGLFEAVEDLFEQVDEMEGVRATVHIEGKQRRLKENTEIMLFRIIQEMVNNSLKHAEAESLQLDLKLSNERFDIVYSDDGKGFDVSEKIMSRSIGLTSIQSRVKFLNGEVSIQSEHRKGSQFNIQIPLV